MGDSKSSLGFLVLLVIVLFSGTSSDTHSLSYNFTIDPWPRDDQPWCEVQGEVDQKVFLSYDCGTAKIKYMSLLGEEVKNMSSWEAQTVTLRDTGDLLQEHMPDVTPEKHTDKVGSGPLTLQARMTCWREDDGHTNASWGFGFNGQLCLLFDSENGHWTVVHPGGRQITTDHSPRYSAAHGPSQPSLHLDRHRGSHQFCHNGHHNRLYPLQEEETVLPGSAAGVLSA